MPIKNIVFDLGGVLVDWNPRYLYRKIFSSEHEMEKFLAEICTQEWNEQQDAGRPFAEAEKELIQRHPSYEKQIRMYRARWVEMLGGPILPTVEILNDLLAAKKHRLFALTNWSHETFPMAKSLYPFLQSFEGILVSGEVKLKKPDPLIFQMLCQHHKINAEESIFIDDVLKNVKAAEALGFHVMQFINSDKLRQDLMSLKIL